MMLLNLESWASIATIAGFFIAIIALAVSFITLCITRAINNQVRNSINARNNVNEKIRKSCLQFVKNYYDDKKINRCIEKYKNNDFEEEEYFLDYGIYGSNRVNVTLYSEPNKMNFINLIRYIKIVKSVADFIEKILDDKQFEHLDKKSAKALDNKINSIVNCLSELKMNLEGLQTVSLKYQNYDINDPHLSKYQTYLTFFCSYVIPLYDKKDESHVKDAVLFYSQIEELFKNNSDFSMHNFRNLISSIECEPFIQWKESNFSINVYKEIKRLEEDGDKKPSWMHRIISANIKKHLRPAIFTTQKNEEIIIKRDSIAYLTIKKIIDNMIIKNIYDTQEADNNVNLSTLPFLDSEFGTKILLEQNINLSSGNLVKKIFVLGEDSKITNYKTRSIPIWAAERIIANLTEGISKNKYRTLGTKTRAMRSELEKIVRPNPRRLMRDHPGK